MSTWEQLKARATHTDKMGPVLHPYTNGGFLKSITLNSDIEFHVNLDTEGYLILLEKEPSGVVCCLSPSDYAPQPYFAAGRAILPQPSSWCASFGSDETGKEEILVCLTKEMPPLAWLPRNGEEAPELDENRLNQLLDYLNHSPDSQVLYTEYTVVKS